MHRMCARGQKVMFIYPLFMYLRLLMAFFSVGVSIYACVLPASACLQETVLFSRSEQLRCYDEDDTDDI